MLKRSLRGWRLPWRSRSGEGSAQQLGEKTFPAEATAEDIYACFRLLLGRYPHPQEWPGHSGFVGRPLDEMVRSYVNSLEFQRRGLLERRLNGVESRNFGRFEIFADPTDNEVGAPVLAGAYEPHVARIFENLLRPGQSVVDVGANIGFFTLLAASLVGPAGSVLAVEPNPRNVRLLEASRRRNGFSHVTVAQVAASDHLGLLALHAGKSNGTTAEPPPLLADLIAAETVPCLPLDRLVEANQPIALIKVDVEGAEGLVLRGALGLLDRHRPHVVSEFCPDGIQQLSGMPPAAYLGLFTDRGYGVHVITSTGLESCGQDHERVMAAFAASRVDHIDLLFDPAG